MSHRTRILGTLISLGLCASAFGDIINVPADSSTIQVAIDTAIDGDEIIVAPGTYFENINLLGKAVTLRSSAGLGAAQAWGQWEQTHKLTADDPATGIPAGASAQEYTVLDLGTLGGSECRAWAINDAGTAVGWSRVESGELRAFKWHLGVMKTIGPLADTYSWAWNINNTDQIVGQFSTDPGEHAFLWDNGELIDLGTFGGPHSRARGINEWGQAVGSADISAPYQGHAFLYSEAEMIDLGTLGGDSSGASDVNDSGVVCGASFRVPGSTDPGDVGAFIWSPNGGMQELGDLGGDRSSAFALNNHMQAVGSSYTNNSGSPNSHAFLWENGVMIDLGTLGGSVSLAYDIADDQTIVGMSRTPDSGYEYRAFIYRDGVMTNLNELIPPDNPFDSLEQANGINEVGQIVGRATTNGLRRAFLLTPVAIDCNANGIQDEQDIAAGLSPDSNGNNVPDECDECVHSNDCGAGEVCVNGECHHPSDLCPDDDGDGRVTICHTPPGNPDNARTMTVRVNAVLAHLAHGDYCGPCQE